MWSVPYDKALNIDTKKVATSYSSGSLFPFSPRPTHASPLLSRSTYFFLLRYLPISYILESNPPQIQYGHHHSRPTPCFPTPGFCHTLFPLPRMSSICATCQYSADFILFNHLAACDTIDYTQLQACFIFPTGRQGYVECWVLSYFLIVLYWMYDIQPI